MTEVLVAIILSFIWVEAPNVKRSEALTADFKADITETVQMHAEVAAAAPASLVDPLTDVLIMSAVTYRESRFRLPPVDGDCRMTHPLIHLPSGSWPKDYKPVLKKDCRAVGPQQLNKGGVKHLPPWPEIQALFPARDWATPAGRKKDKLTEAQLRDPRTNIKLSYGVLLHWKNVCTQVDGSPAPVGVWYTAYRYGRCPFLGKNKKYHIDAEAKERCRLVEAMAAGFESSTLYALPEGFRCTYDSSTLKRQTVAAL